MKLLKQNYYDYLARIGHEFKNSTWILEFRNCRTSEKRLLLWLALLLLLQFAGLKFS